ncbi:MAG: 2-hydroxymuconate tautomerase [Candidatus Korobacteraceae bacterium]|jgi:4-oxalocrotonate tautomerase
MPLAHIFMLQGRTDEQKKAVIEKVTQAIMEAVSAPRENVRVIIQEIPKTQWGIGGKTAKDLGR